MLIGAAVEILVLFWSRITTAVPNLKKVAKHSPGGPAALAPRKEYSNSAARVRLSSVAGAKCSNELANRPKLVLRR